jgi:hypothetical protein
LRPSSARSEEIFCPVKNKLCFSLCFQTRVAVIFAFLLLKSEEEELALYDTWNKGWVTLSEKDKDARNAKLTSRKRTACMLFILPQSQYPNYVLLDVTCISTGQANPLAGASPCSYPSALVLHGAFLVTPTVLTSLTAQRRRHAS